MAAGSASDEVVRSLYEEHGAALLSFALRLCSGDRGRAEDVVQETVLRAWRHPAALDESRGALRPWLFTVARNVAVDGYRARRARPAEVSTDSLAAVPAGDEIDRALESWLVADALTSLTAEHRAVLAQTYYLGRSVAEAATVLGVPPGTVKSRTYYALRALKLALEERGVTT